MKNLLRTIFLLIAVVFISTGCASLMDSPAPTPVVVTTPEPESLQSEIHFDAKMLPGEDLVVTIARNGGDDGKVADDSQKGGINFVAENLDGSEDLDVTINRDADGKSPTYPVVEAVSAKTDADCVPICYTVTGTELRANKEEGYLRSQGYCVEVMIVSEEVMGTLSGKPWPGVKVTRKGAPEDEGIFIPVSDRALKWGLCDDQKALSDSLPKCESKPCDCPNGARLVLPAPPKNQGK